MKALSLWQPWAGAIALGYKKIETRHWFTNYRGTLAIHAAKRWTREEREFTQEFNEKWALLELPEQPPLGCVVALATLREIRPTEGLVHWLGPIERALGNYEPGRFGWMLDHITELKDPIPCTGRQGLFDLPADVFAQMRSQLAWHLYIQKVKVQVTP